VENHLKFGIGWLESFIWLNNKEILFRHSCESIRTIPCDYALCCMFLPGDHSVLIGCKVRESMSGNLI